MIWQIALTILAGYLLGNLNGAIIISGSVYHDDVRKHGSGNAGMTNFLRTYGASRLLAVIVIDMGKTALSCLIGWLLLRQAGYGDEGKMLGGMACLLGHALPVFYGFRGGKCVLSASALALCMHWWYTLLVLAIFLLILLTTHYMSLASITAVTIWSVGAIIIFWGKWFIMICAAVMAAAIIWLHRGNISRLLHGTERKTYLHNAPK